MADLDDFIAGLPKAELHIHIEGSLEPEQMFLFARRNGLKLPYNSVAEIREAYNFSNLQDFLDIYYQGASVLQTGRDFHEMTLAYLVELHRAGGHHAEIFFDPQTHLARGVSIHRVMEGLTTAMLKAERDFEMSSSLIMCFLRHLSEEDAFKTLDTMANWIDCIDGVGLDSSEVGHPPSKFARVFEECRKRGLKVVAHAGEEGPPEYVWEALDILKVDRIDHGNRALEDPKLVQRLVDEQMTLTVCPLSNHKLKVVEDLTQHPLKKMLDLGLKVTVNSDDPAYFGGYLNANYRAIAKALNLSKADLVQLARNSFTGSFMDRDLVADWLYEIDLYAAGFPD